MVKHSGKKLLRVVFSIDALMAIGFGLYSWLFPQDTFGTIIAIPHNATSVFEAIFAVLSAFYMLIGFTCVIGILARFPENAWIGALMIIRHLSEATLKIFDMEAEWAIGNPWPDLIIHTLFIVAYSWSVIWTYANRSKESSGN
ncbi:MAG TPA: hypothetical protein VGK59_18470 [Ohtaekwangia sp.]